MKLFAFDLGSKVGWAFGDSDAHPPRIGVERVKRKGSSESPEIGAGYFARWLVAFMREHGRPDVYIVEQYMNPAASHNEGATVAQIMLHGALNAVAGLYRIPVYPVAVATVRVHFCGRAYAVKWPRGHHRTDAEKKEAKRATKRMVEERAKQLGYLPRSYQVGVSDDRNEADAAALFDWGVAHVARQQSLLKSLGEKSVEKSHRVSAAVDG
jgi:hypothetical protein